MCMKTKCNMCHKIKIMGCGRCNIVLRQNEMCTCSRMNRQNQVNRQNMQTVQNTQNAQRTKFNPLFKRF